MENIPKRIEHIMNDTNIKKKLLSIISIGLNYDDLIQTYKTAKIYFNESWVEYIIVSPYVEKLKNFCNKKNITLVEDSKKGCYAAMNKGIKYTKGKFLWFLNSGDIAKKINREELLFLRFLLKESDNTLLFSRKFSQFHKPLSGLISQNNFLKIYLINLIMPVSHQNILMKNSDKILFDEKLVYNSDFKLLFSKLFRNLIKIQFVDLEIAILSKGGISDKNRFNVLLERFNLTFKNGFIIFKLITLISFLLRIYYLWVTNIIKFLINK